MEAESVDADQLSLVKQMLVEKTETLKVLDDEMAELVPDEELEEEILRTDEYKERVYGVLAKLDKALGPTTTPPPTTVAETGPRPLAEHPTPAVETDRLTTERRTISTGARLPTTDRVNCPR